MYVYATMPKAAATLQASRGMNQRISRRTMSKALLGALIPVARKQQAINTLLNRSTSSDRPTFERVLQKIARCRNASSSAQNAMNAVALLHAATKTPYLTSNRRKNMIYNALNKVKYC